MIYACGKNGKTDITYQAAVAKLMSQMETSNKLSPLTMKVIKDKQNS